MATKMFEGSLEKVFYVTELSGCLMNRKASGRRDEGCGILLIDCFILFSLASTQTIQGLIYSLLRSVNHGQLDNSGPSSLIINYN